MGLPFASSPAERFLSSIIEELKLLLGEVSGLRGDVKALRDVLLAQKQPQAVAAAATSSLEVPAPAPAKVEPPRSGARQDWGKAPGKRR